MTDKERKETLERLKARLECDKRQVHGNRNICNPPYMCEECDFCYAQGTLGERNIDLERAIEALSVNAIPIERIKEWVKTKPLGMESLIAPEYTIEALLYWWEKENETN